MRFLADMGVATSIVDELRRQGHDALHLREQHLQRASDQEILDKAAAENRILLTLISAISPPWPVVALSA